MRPMLSPGGLCTSPMLNRFLTLLAVLVLGSAQAAAQSTLLSLSNPNASATVALASTTFSTFRTEFRIENLALNGTTRYVWGVGAFPSYLCNIPGGALVMVCQFGGDANPQGGTTI